MSDHNSALFLRFRSDNDMRALAKVFDRTAPEIASVARHLARSSDEAEDLVQATFLAAIESSAQFDPRRPLLPWLLGILTMQARKQRERANRTIDPDRVHAPQVAQPDRDAQMLEIHTAVESAVSQLDGNYAGIVRRHLLEGATPSMLAREFELSSITARVRLHRGIKQLRKLLPASMAGTAFGVGMSNFDFASLRSKVLERASQLTGAPLPAASFVSAGLVIALLVPIAVAAPAVIKWRTRASTQPATTELALAPAAVEPATSKSAPLEVEPSAALEPAPLPAPPATQPAAKIQEQHATLRGRLLRADGSPATGATLRLEGFSGSDTPESSAATNWSDPPPSSNSADGRFELQFAPPPGFSFWLRVEAPDCATAAWRWQEVQAAGTIDLGDVELEPGYSLPATLVNDHGEALFIDWSITATVAAPDTSNGRTRVSIQAARDPANSTFTFTGLPARRVEFRARTSGGASSEKLVFAVAAGQQAPVQLVYRGPDLRKRITCLLSLPNNLPLWVQPEHIWIEKPGSAPLEAQYVQGTSQSYQRSDLEPGQYTVRMEDSRLMPWSQENVQPGTTVHPLVRGNAALRLSILEPDQSRYLGRYRLSVARYGNSTPGGIEALVSANVDPPQNGLIEHLVPGSYELELKIEGRSLKSITVSTLHPLETRDIEVSFSAPAALQGRVLSPDGASPAPNVDVQLTRGAIAGHTMGKGTQIMWEHKEIPPIQTRATTDAEGKFNFSNLQAGEWTVRAAWSRWVFVDRTVTLPMSAPIDIGPPASGYFSGRLIVPEGASLANILVQATVRSEGLGYQPMQVSPEAATLNSDGTFQMGPMPVGTIDAGFTVFSEVVDELGSGKNGIGESLGTYQIVSGAPTPVEIDLRAIYPAQLHGSVKLDGVLATGGLVTARFVQGGNGGFKDPASAVTIDGLFSLGVVRANRELSLDYVAAAGWSWSLPLPLNLAPGSIKDQIIAIETIEREVQIVDALTHQPRADQRIAWRTGRDFSATSDEPDALAMWTAKTDAQGMIHVRLPAGPARAVAIPSGSFTPSTVEWTHGSGTIVLQFAAGH